MKNTINLIIISIIITLLCSCGEQYVKSKKHTISSDIEELDTVPGYNGLKVLSFDSCEYIVIGSGNWRWGTHRGNCRNSIHNNQSKNKDSIQILNDELKEMKEYIKKLEQDNKLLGSYLGSKEFNR